MKESVSIYPFAVYAETKVSEKTGNPYDIISVAFNTKDKSGQKVTNYFNLFDERDLLVLANVLNTAFVKIKKAKYEERFGEKKEEPKVEQPKTEGVQSGLEDSSFDDNLDGIFG